MSGAAHAYAPAPATRPAPRPARREEANGGAGAPIARWSFASLDARPLPEETRHELEGRFGRGLADVRVHAGEAGRTEAARHSALAVARGSDVFFAPGEYAPGTERGDRILRHEVAHLVQARSAGPAWPEPLLEAEAEVASAGPGAVAIAGRTGRDAPHAMKTFVATVGGGAGYLEAAVKFYKLWENETAIRIDSHQQVVNELAKDTAPLSEFRLVGHGNEYNLFLPLLAKGSGKDYAGTTELGIQTQALLATALGNKAHVTSDMTGTVFGWLSADKEAAGLLGRLGLKAAPTGMLKEFLWWVVDEQYAVNAKESGTGTLTTPGEQNALGDELRPIQAAVKELAATGLPSTASKADLDELRTRALDAFVKQGWTWTVAPGDLKEKLTRFRDPDTAAMAREVKAGTYEKTLQKVKARVSAKTHIEIRGCNVGKLPDWLNAARAYYGTAPDKLPSIEAPMLYQFFGQPGVQVLPEGGKAPPIADSLKFLFEETFDDTSAAKDISDAVKKAHLESVKDLGEVLKHADIKAQFDAWFQMRRTAAAPPPKPGAPATTPTPATLKDFQDFITSQQQTFPINAPGIAPESLFFLLLVPSGAIPALVAWVDAQGYRLPSGESTSKQLFGGATKWDPAKFKKGLDQLYVDWLGDEYPVPKNIYFPESPTYKASFRRIP
jgi:hypothetical protein